MGAGAGVCSGGVGVWWWCGGGSVVVVWGRGVMVWGRVSVVVMWGRCGGVGAGVVVVWGEGVMVLWGRGCVVWERGAGGGVLGRGFSHLHADFNFLVGEWSYSRLTSKQTIQFIHKFSIIRT